MHHVTRGSVHPCIRSCSILNTLVFCFWDEEQVDRIPLMHMFTHTHTETRVHARSCMLITPQKLLYRAPIDELTVKRGARRTQHTKICVRTHARAYYLSFFTLLPQIWYKKTFTWKYIITRIPMMRLLRYHCIVAIFVMFGNLATIAADASASDFSEFWTSLQMMVISCLLYLAQHLIHKCFWVLCHVGRIWSTRKRLKIVLYC